MLACFNTKAERQSLSSNKTNCTEPWLLFLGFSVFNKANASLPQKIDISLAWLHRLVRFVYLLVSLLPAVLLGGYVLLIRHSWLGFLWSQNVFESSGDLINSQLIFGVKVLNVLDTSLVFFLDDLSSLFIVMTVLVISIICLSLDSVFSSNGVGLGLLLLVLEYTLVGVFLAHDFVSFFFFFEATLIPMFLLIILNGGGENRTKAAYWLAMFTLLSSIFFILPVLWLYSVSGLSTFAETQEFFLNHMDESSQAMFVCFFFFLAFAIKIPLMPFHVWLPEVHVEAPTLGSMVLASLLLKLGGYGVVRICLGVFPVESSKILDFAAPFLLLSVVLSALIAIVQTDTKKVVAYSSVAHMGVALLGLIAFTEWGYLGAILSMFAHSLTAPALFFLVGCLYDRYATRNLIYFGGLFAVMPLFAVVFFLFILSNTSFPGFVNFVGEVNVIFGFTFFKQWTWPASLALITGILLIAAYNFLLFARLLWGSIKSASLMGWVDLVPAELSFLGGLLVFLIGWGVYHQPLIFFVIEGFSVL